MINLACRACAAAERSTTARGLFADVLHARRRCSTWSQASSGHAYCTHPRTREVVRVLYCELYTRRHCFLLTGGVHLAVTLNIRRREAAAVTAAVIQDGGRKPWGLTLSAPPSHQSSLTSFFLFVPVHVSCLILSSTFSHYKPPSSAHLLLTGPLTWAMGYYSNE